MVKKHTVALLIIFTTALGIRLWFLAQLQHDLVFHLPVCDPMEFNFLAFQILQHGWVWPSLPYHIPPYYTPLYPYFMAVIYHIFGFHINAVAIIQCLMGAFCACLMYLLTLRLADPVAAIVCAECMTFYWFFIYTQVFLFNECLQMTINIVMIYYLIIAKESWKKYFWAGLLLGASLLCRPDRGLFAGLILIWIWGQHRDHKRALFCFGIFLLTTMAVLSPVLVRNHAISGSWTLRSQVGCNLYLGNDPDSYGSNIFIEQGRPWQKFASMPFEGLGPGTVLTEKQINDFYLKKTIQKIADHPFSWGRLILGKVWSILGGREFLRSEDIYFRDYFVAPTSIQVLSTQLIFVSALAGFFAAWKMRGRHQLLILLLLSSIPSIFFPAKTRYLVPIIPFVIFYASIFVSSVYEAVKIQDQIKLAKLMGGLFVCFLASSINPLNLKEPNVSETYYALALNLHYQKDYKLAQQTYEYALDINPSNSAAWNDLSTLYFSKQDLANALDSLRKAAASDQYYATKYEMARNMVMQGQPVPWPFTHLEWEDVDDFKIYEKVFRYSLPTLNKITPPIYM